MKLAVILELGRYLRRAKGFCVTAYWEKIFRTCNHREIITANYGQVVRLLIKLYRNVVMRTTRVHITATIFVSEQPKIQLGLEITRTDISYIAEISDITRRSKFLSLQSRSR